MTSRVKSLILLIILVIPAAIFLREIPVLREKILSESRDSKRWQSAIDSSVIQSQVIGKVFEDTLLLDNEDNLTSLYHEINRQEKYTLVILTSIASCSSCRDEELVSWNKNFELNTKMPLILIASEMDLIDATKRRQLRVMLHSMRIKIPLFFDKESQILHAFGLEPSQTPIAMIVDNQGRVINASRPTEVTGVLNENFKEDALEIIQHL